MQSFIRTLTGNAQNAHKLVLERLNMGLKMRQHEQVPCAEIALQTGAEFLALLLELATGQAEYVLDGLAFDQSTHARMPAFSRWAYTLFQ